MYFTFNQNNSGGSFDLDVKKGITHIVIIYATSHEEANRKAENIGIYFNGVEEERDCSCCGDRWYSNSDKGSKTPIIYGKSPQKYLKEEDIKWMKRGREICVHLKNGKMEWY